MNNLFVIIEGPDNVGKTTLIKNIKNHYNDYFLHELHYSNVKQDKDKVQEYSTKLYHQMFNLMFQSTIHEKFGFIVDRSHLGEMVYGPIYRNYSGEFVLDIERSYHHILDFWNDVYLITLYDSPENLIKRDDGLSFSIDNNIKQKEIDNFLNAHRLSTIKHKLLINIEYNDEKQTINKAIDFIQEVKNGK